MEVVGKVVKRRGRSVLALTQFSKTDRQTPASIKGASQDIWPCQKENILHCAQSAKEEHDHRDRW